MSEDIKRRLLLVEDDASLGETLTERLRKEGYEVEWQSTQASAERAWRLNKFDLIVLDVGLPDGSGFDFARMVAGESKTPFIFVTAMNGAEQRLEGYEIGAEEFIPKPFHLKELLIRVKHVLNSHAGDHLRFEDGSSVDFSGRMMIRANGETEFFPAREFELLRLLTERSPKPLSRDEILNEIWGEDKFPSHRTVDNAILRLRQILGDVGSLRIRSVRGVGYQWLQVSDRSSDNPSDAN